MSDPGRAAPGRWAASPSDPAPSDPRTLRRSGTRRRVAVAGLGLLLAAGTAVGVGLSPPRLRAVRVLGAQQMLEDPSVELRGAGSPWRSRVGATGAARGDRPAQASSTARSGSGAGLASPGRDLRQAIAVGASSGLSYRFEAWVRADGPRATGTLAATTRCATVERVETPFTVGRRWTLVSATLGARHADGCSLGVEVTAVSGAVLVDDAALTDVELANPSFELGRSGWRAGNHPESVTFEVAGPPVGDPADGLSVARLRSTLTGGSIAGDLVLDRSSEPFVAEVSARVRGSARAPRSATVPVTLAVFGLCGDLVTNSATNADIGGSWQTVAVRFRMSAAQEKRLIVPFADPCVLRVEIYVQRADETVEIDALSLRRTSVPTRR